MNTAYPKTRLVTCIFSFFILATTLFPTSVTVNAQLTTEVAVKNSATQNRDFLFYTNVTSIGERFNATVWVYNVTDLFAYQVNLNVDDALLNITNAWLPTWDASWVFNGVTTVRLSPTLYDFDRDGCLETALIGDSILAGDTFNGEGILAILEFKIIDTPEPLKTLETELDIDDPDTILQNHETTDIPTSRTNGRFHYVWLEPRLEVKPSQYVAVSEGEVFNITIWMHNVTESDRLVSASFKLQYNATLLNITQASEGPFLSRFNNTSNPPYTDFQYFIEENHVNISTKILPANGDWTIFPQGHGEIVTITFQSIHQNDEENQCPLELLDAQMEDDDGNLMTNTPPKNGYYIVRPQLSSFLTMDVNPSVTAVGAPVTLEGTLKPPEAGANISIYYRLLSEKWVLLATAQTDINGNYTFQWTTNQIGAFELKANWTGNHNLPAESNTRGLIVEKISSTITIFASPLISTTGSNITVHGEIAPSKENVPVTIYCKRTSDTWKTLASVTTDSQGAYKYEWKTQRAGSYELYANWQGDSQTSSAESSKTMITLERLDSTISIHTFPSVATVGSDVVVNGTVSPFRPGVSVTIYFREVGNESWSELYTATDAQGHYNKTWMPPKNATFEFYAWWGGDENTYSNVSSLMTLEVKLASELTIRAFPSVATVGSDVVVNGTVSPFRPGVSVTIYFRKVGNESWSELASVTADADSHFSLNWTTQESGRYEFKATWTGDEHYKGSDSEATSVLVKADPHFPSTTVYLIIAGTAISGLAISLLIYRKSRKEKT